LSGRHRAAHDLLYTRPCDLPAATRAVHGYQQLLAALAGGLAGGNPSARAEDEGMRR
jgi:hypothetical protein